VVPPPSGRLTMVPAAPSVSAKAMIAPPCRTAGRVQRSSRTVISATTFSGAIMAFADTLGAAGTIVNLPEGGGTTTIESKTNFVAPAPVGTRVTGECTPVHRGRRTMIWQTRVTTPEGRLVALVTQTQLVL